MLEILLQVESVLSWLDKSLIFWTATQECCFGQNVNYLGEFKTKPQFKPLFQCSVCVVEMHLCFHSTDVPLVPPDVSARVGRQWRGRLSVQSQRGWLQRGQLGPCGEEGHRGQSVSLMLHSWAAGRREFNQLVCGRTGHQMGAGSHGLSLLQLRLWVLDRQETPSLQVRPSTSRAVKYHCISRRF